jgi:hypothetical protein
MGLAACLISGRRQPDIELWKRRCVFWMGIIRRQSIIEAYDNPIIFLTDLSILAPYNFHMSSEYWQPIVQCKNPECFSGKPTFLPFPNLPTMNEAQPDWPADDWQPFLICMHCGIGHIYSRDDVEWSAANNKNGLRENQLIQYAELKCAQKTCGHPVKVYLKFDDTMNDKDRDRMLETGTVGATCEQGHPPAKPFRIIKSLFVSAIRRYRPTVLQAK